MALPSRTLLFSLLAGLLGVLASCSSGGGSEPVGSGSFRVLGISVGEGDTWKINRPIDVVFSEEVDFASVNLNSISVRTLLGQPASGAFELLDSRTVRFLPNCPTLADASDAGLLPSQTYRILVLGSDVGAPTVLSASGEVLDQGLSRIFFTPDSSLSQELFLDTVAGPPAIVLRGRDGVPTDAVGATYLETLSIEESGELVPRRTYFRWDAVAQRGVLEEGPWLPVDELSGEPRLPLNLFSRLETQVAVLLFIDQPVDPAEDNVGPGQISLEYDAGATGWQEVATRVELLDNCTEVGALLRLTPRGILPQDSGLRVNLRSGFRDLTGDRTLFSSTELVKATVTVADNPVAGDTDEDRQRSADEILAGFEVGGPGEGSLEDTLALFGDPAAEWGGGKLEAAFEFGGTGGPGGDFTWRIPAGTTRILDTSVDVITGGPNGVPTTSQTVIGGVVDVYELVIEEGAALLVQGPNPLTILASRDVRIDGILSAEGTSAQSVATLNTTHQPEPGGPGQASGGAGGSGSYLTTQSTPRGGAGNGAFDQAGTGGQGGETSYHPDERDKRRGAGGGGGRLGADVIFPFDPSGTPSLTEDPNVRCQTVIGLDAEAGMDGGFGGLGAESQAERAAGGAIAPGPFFDEDPENDFFGSKIITRVEFEGGVPVLEEELILGELGGPTGGGGGGGGGDAVQFATFPLVPFIDTGDEKAAGGGGGAGAIRILSTGDVILGPAGQLGADGGAGGGGENVGFFDRVGGGGGGGSGGHVIISTAGRLLIESPGAEAAASTSWYNDASTGDRRRPITALGGQGGAGWGNVGGANELGGTPWFCDGIPFSAFLEVNTGEPVPIPPIDINCFKNLEGVDISPGDDPFDWADPDNVGNPAGGGDGGPGIIQVHVNDSSTDVVFPDGSIYGEGAAVTRWFAPPPYGWNSPSGIDVTGNGQTVTVPPDYMVPFFGRLSRSRSRWIPLGLARVNPGGQPVGLQFRGTTAGLVDQAGDQVDLGAPLFGPLAMGAGTGGLPEVVGDAGTTLVLDASGLTGADEIYRRNPVLLRDLLVQLEKQGAPSIRAYFDVADASYDPELDRLTLEVQGSTSLGIAGVAPEETLVSLLRRDLRVITGSVVDFLPGETSVEILFQATVVDGDGKPSESAASELTADISSLNLDPMAPGDYVPWDFLRFQVTFDLNAQGDSGSDLASTPRPALDFLRVPFSF